MKNAAWLFNIRSVVNKSWFLVSFFLLNVLFFIVQRIHALPILACLFIALDVCFFLLSKDRICFLTSMMFFPTVVNGLHIWACSNILAVEALLFYSFFVVKSLFKTHLVVDKDCFFLAFLIAFAQFLFIFTSYKNGTGDFVGAIQNLILGLLPILYCYYRKAVKPEYDTTQQWFIWFFCFIYFVSCTTSYFMGFSEGLSKIFGCGHDGFKGFLTNRDFLPIPIILFMVYSAIEKFDISWQRWSFYGMEAVLTLIAVFSTSKMEIVCLAIFAFVLLWKLIKKAKRKASIALLLLSFVVAFVYIVFRHKLYAFFYGRIFYFINDKNGILSAITTYRNLITYFFSQGLMEDPLYFLAGKGNVYNLYSAITGEGSSHNHNTFTYFVSYYGVFGGGFMLYYLFDFLIFPFCPNRKKSPEYLVLFWGCFFVLLFALNIMIVGDGMMACFAFAGAIQKSTVETTKRPYFVSKLGIV